MRLTTPIIIKWKLDVEGEGPSRLEASAIPDIKSGDTVSLETFWNAFSIKWLR